ncbi:sugar-transfer associated ATP-grasp domain-containing protein [Flagellimonas marinaquae]
MKPIRFVYLGYYLKKLDWYMLFSFMDVASKSTGKRKLRLWVEMLRDSLTYNISILEYFQFGFYKGLTHDEKDRWAGTGYMYEYQKIMNPPHQRHILDDKRHFYKIYQRYFKHHVVSLSELESDINLAAIVLQEETVVLKQSKGKCGLGTAFFKSQDFTSDALVSFMKKEGYDLAETFIQQHPDLNRLSPSGVNTVRIFTQINTKGQVDILGCRQRISVNSQVDNMAAGNLAAPIDETSGIINGPGVYSDITKAPESHHPITGAAIMGFKVPYWGACLDLAINAAKLHPENQSIGWDIVVTPSGPGLIEGNHDWCKLVWQLPVYRGMKQVLQSYLI